MVPSARLFMNVMFEFKRCPLGAVEKEWSVTELVRFLFILLKRLPGGAIKHGLFSVKFLF